MAFHVYYKFTNKLTEDEQGHLYVQTELPDNEMLYPYILFFTDCVKILEPQINRKRAITKIEDVLPKFFNLFSYTLCQSIL